jgi:hypothetical protein
MSERLCQLNLQPEFKNICPLSSDICPMPYAFPFRIPHSHFRIQAPLSSILCQVNYHQSAIHALDEQINSIIFLMSIDQVIEIFQRWNIFRDGVLDLHPMY